MGWVTEIPSMSELKFHYKIWHPPDLYQLFLLSPPMQTMETHDKNLMILHDLQSYLKI